MKTDTSPSTIVADAAAVSPAAVTGFASVSSAIGAADNYSRWVLAAALGAVRPNSLLEVGIGHANYRSLMPFVSDYMGADIDEDVIQAARTKLPADQFRKVDMCDVRFADEVGRGRYAFLLCINSLQYADDPGIALANFLAALQPSGRIAVLLPAMPMIYGRMDRLAGHRQRYTRRDVRTMIAGLPVTDSHIRFFNPIGALGWWANNFSKSKALDDQSLSGQIALFDKYLVPLSRFADPMTRTFWGQSILWTAQKT